MHFSSIFAGTTQTLRKEVVKQAVQQHTGNDQKGDSVLVAA